MGRQFTLRKRCEQKVKAELASLRPLITIHMSQQEKCTIPLIHTMHPNTDPCKYKNTLAIKNAERNSDEKKKGVKSKILKNNRMFNTLDS